MIIFLTLTSDWNNAERRLLFQPPPGMNYSTDIWAPELHLIAQRWYVIFTADPHGDSPVPEVDMLCDYNCPAVYHRMFVLESNSTEPWTATFSMKSQLDTYDQFAIDGTYFQHSSGLYHVYSCWYGQYISWPANLCISKSKDITMS
jgi:GH43 family beta-xylosidase